MEKLTRKQQRVYDFIRESMIDTGAPPTRAEIANALGFASANAAQAHLQTLHRKGLIELGARRSRGIRLVDADALSFVADNDESGDSGLAVIGRVAAGVPIQAVEHVSRRLHIDPSVFSSPPDYLLIVHGDSMIGAGILDGDLLGVKSTTDLRVGQIAVFRLDDEVTVKRFYRDGSGIRLAADNPAFADIHLDPTRDSLNVEGIAVGVLRSI
ncbi:MAG: transcriptional repressor LexA [Salinisphaera sp.]|nr:transcriptional repressor LexA [Salinisphaera sp.]